METVSLSSVKECTLQQRNIFVICIRLSTEIKFFLNKQYCHFSPPKEIIYGLEYLELDETTEKIDISLYEKLNNNCNELLIYCELDIKLDRILEHILSLFKTFTLKKTVYLLANSFVLNLNLEEKFKTYFHHYNFNLFETSFLPVTFEISSPHFTHIHYNEGDLFSLDLTCQPWFRKFLSRVFSCGVNRLLQLSGTCYLNAVINGIVLSPVLLNLFLSKMKEFVSKFPESKAYISLALDAKDMTSCRIFKNQSSDEIQFLYRIIYNLICKSIRPFPRIKYDERKDVFIQASQDYFGSTTTGVGGVPFATFLHFLNGSDIKFQLVMESDDGTNLVFAKLLQTDVQITMENIHFHIEKADLLFDTEILIYLPKTSSTTLTNESTIKMIKSLFFEEQAGMLELEVSSSMGDNGLHAVSCFLCNGVPKAYDSAQNIIFEVNWFGDKKDFKQSWNTLSLWKIKSSYLQYMVFTSFFISDILNKDACFEIEKDIPMSSRELTWDVPLFKLVRLDGFSNYFLELVNRKVPGIRVDFFDKFSPFAKTLYNPNLYENNVGIILSIILNYPTINFNSYPYIAHTIKHDIPEEKFIFENFKFMNYENFLKVYPNVERQGSVFSVSQNVLDDLAKNKQFDIMANSNLIMKSVAFWDEIYETNPNLNWKIIERRYLVTRRDFKKIEEDFPNGNIPYRILKYYHKDWDHLKKFNNKISVHWGNYEEKWKKDFVSLLKFI